MKNDTKTTQVESIKKHLLRGWSITPLQALNKYGCFRLASVIHILRYKHTPVLPVETHMVTENGKTFAKYKLQKGFKLSK